MSPSFWGASFSRVLNQGIRLECGFEDLSRGMQAQVKERWQPPEARRDKEWIFS